MINLTFNPFRKNIHSQNGEDGVVEEILKRLAIQSGQFVEFGAWDGKHLSNTFALLERGWEGVYIEGDKAKYSDLLKNMEKFPGRVDAVQSMVEITGANSLDSLLSSTRVKSDFELLSIDIDTYDWFIWESLSNYFPSIVIIEINSFIPVGVVQTHRDGQIAQSSFSATLSLGQHKGYTLVCHTGNMIFVRNDLVDKLFLTETEINFPEVMFDYTWVKHRRKKEAGH